MYGSRDQNQAVDQQFEMIDPVIDQPVFGAWDVFACRKARGRLEHVAQSRPHLAGIVPDRMELSRQYWLQEGAYASAAFALLVAPNAGCAHCSRLIGSLLSAHYPTVLEV